MFHIFLINQYPFGRCNYAKQLQFQLTQAQNAVIGRIGTAPADGMPSEAMEDMQ